MRRGLGLCLAIALLSAPAVLRNDAPAHPDAVIIEDMPFFSQEAYQCGPTALATVMNYWYAKDGDG